MTVWDSGVYYIPSVRFKSFVSDSIAIIVNTIEMAEDAELKDIKAPIHTPISFEELSPYLLALLIIALLIYANYMVCQKQRESSKKYQNR